MLSWYTRLFLNVYLGCNSTQMKIYALLSCILLAALNASGQEFGGNPPSLKWKQVNTPEVKVIFPTGLEPAGMRAAAIAHYLNRHTSATAGRDHRNQRG